MSQTKHGFPVRNSIMTKRDEIKVFLIAKLTHSSLAYGYKLVNGFVMFIACLCCYTLFVTYIYIYIYLFKLKERMLIPMLGCSVYLQVCVCICIHMCKSPSNIAYLCVVYTLPHHYL